MHAIKWTKHTKKPHSFPNASNWVISFWLGDLKYSSPKISITASNLLRLRGTFSNKDILICTVCKVILIQSCMTNFSISIYVYTVLVWYRPARLYIEHVTTFVRFQQLQVLTHRRSPKMIHPRYVTTAVYYDSCSIKMEDIAMNVHAKRTDSMKQS
jgi:hypothetical protein